MEEPPVRIDLHAHTTASDGLLTPDALVERARSLGVTTLAVTDHDTASGVRALGPGPWTGVEVIPGIEVSSDVEGRELHVLGYFIDPHHPALIAYEHDRREKRRERLAAMVARLAAAGMDITMDDVERQRGGDGAPGRPHLARALVAKGYAESTRDCFDRLLLPGGVGYVPYPKLSAAEAFALIERAGGIPIVAHPGLDHVEDHLDGLVAAGARGIEVWHSAHTAEQTLRYEAYARERDLLATGGSDFHGVGQKEGGELGGTRCPPESFARLAAFAAR